MSGLFKKQTTVSWRVFYGESTLREKKKNREKQAGAGVHHLWDVNAHVDEQPHHCLDAGDLSGHHGRVCFDHALDVHPSQLQVGQHVIHLLCCVPLQRRVSAHHLLDINSEALLQIGFALSVRLFKLFGICKPSEAMWNADTQSMVTPWQWTGRQQALGKADCLILTKKTK